MKKFLIASTALAMTAGAAAAEVKFSGDARFGLQHAGATAGVAGNMNTYTTVGGVTTETVVAGPVTANDVQAARAAVVAAQLAVATATTVAARDAAQDVLTSAQRELAARLGTAATASQTLLEKRMTVNIDASTTSDAGVTFGARVRIRSDENITGISGARVYAQVGGFTVAAGNILGALDSTPGLYGSFGLSYSLTGLGWHDVVGNAGITTGFDAFASRTNGSEGIEAIYSMGDFSAHLSHSSNSLSGTAAQVRRTAAHAAYRFSGWQFAVAMQDSSVAAEDMVGVTATGKVGDIGLNAAVFRVGAGATRDTYMRVGADATFGAVGVGGFVSKYSNNADAAFGLGARYNLGGNAALVGGIVRTPARQTLADVGVTFRF